MAESAFEQWAVVELFGHNKIAGLLTEETRGGTAFLRVDVPGEDGEIAFTKYYNGAAVYAWTPVDEVTARLAASRLQVRPVTQWVVPAPRAEHLLTGEWSYAEDHPDEEDDWHEDMPRR